jgi:hypothetical protein
MLFSKGKKKKKKKKKKNDFYNIPHNTIIKQKLSD